MPDEFAEATAGSRLARQEKVRKRIRNQKIRMRTALGLSACVVLAAVAAYLIGDYAAARLCAMTACLLLALTLIAGAAARKNVANALREADRP